MSKRNIAWLAAIVVIGGIVWIAANFVWGLVAAIVTLVVSEVVQRTARQRRRAARGQASGTELKDVVNARRRRR